MENEGKTETKKEKMRKKGKEKPKRGNAWLSMEILSTEKRKTGKPAKRKKQNEVCRPETMIKNFSRQLTLQKIVEQRNEKKEQPCQATQQAN